MSGPTTWIGEGDEGIMENVIGNSAQFPRPVNSVRQRDGYFTFWQRQELNTKNKGEKTRKRKKNGERKCRRDSWRGRERKKFFRPECVGSKTEGDSSDSRDNLKQTGLIVQKKGKMLCI